MERPAWSTCVDGGLFPLPAGTCRGLVRASSLPASCMEPAPEPSWQGPAEQRRHGACWSPRCSPCPTQRDSNPERGPCPLQARADRQPRADNTALSPLGLGGSWHSTRYPGPAQLALGRLHCSGCIAVTPLETLPQEGGWQGPGCWQAGEVLQLGLGQGLSAPPRSLAEGSAPAKLHPGRQGAGAGEQDAGLPCPCPAPPCPGSWLLLALCLGRCGPSLTLPGALRIHWAQPHTSTVTAGVAGLEARQCGPLLCHSPGARQSLAGPGSAVTPGAWTAQPGMGSATQRHQGGSQPRGCAEPLHPSTSHPAAGHARWGSPGPRCH